MLTGWWAVLGLATISSTVQVWFSFLTFATALLRSSGAFFRGQSKQAVVELALRQQLAAYAQARPRPRLAPLDRAFWVLLHQVWPRWKEDLVVVKRMVTPSGFSMSENLR